MKKFFLFIFLFLLPVIIVGVATEMLVRNIPNSYQLKADYLEQHSNEIETLILGSSHTFYGVAPRFLDTKAFNAANVSQTVDIDEVILQQYTQTMPNLKSIVIRLSYTTLFEKLSETTEKWRIKDYNIYMDLSLDNHLKYHSEVLSMKLKTNFNDIYKYYFLNENVVNCNPLGWGTDASSDNARDLDKTGPLVAKKHTITDRHLLEENIQVFERLVAFCNKRDINIILVTTPTYESYFTNLDENQLGITVETAKNLEKKYPNCNYYNYLKSDLFSANDFFDADHLNEKGAKKFSLRINEILEQQTIR